MSFSRRQWWFFFGGLFVTAVGTIEYMEQSAIRRFLSELSEVTLKSETLSYELFRNAGLFAKSANRVLLTRSEKLISMTCKALADPTHSGEVRAAAANFLCELWEDEDSHEVILDYLDIVQLGHDFVTQSKAHSYDTSVALLLASALSTRPPTLEKEESLHYQRMAMRRAWPLISLSLLEKISSDPYTHKDIIDSGAIKSTLEMMQAPDIDSPIGTELLYQLSKTEEGRQALILNDAFHITRTIAFDTESPLYEMYNEDFVGNFAHINFTGMFSNLFLSNLTQLMKRHPDLIRGVDEAEKKELETFNREEAKTKKILLNQLATCIMASAAAGIWAPLRGISRNWWRGLDVPFTTAAFSSAARAMIGAPLLVAGSIGITEVQKRMKDDRLFLTTNVLGTTTLIFAVRWVFAFAPFSLAPSILAYLSVMRPSKAESQVRMTLLKDFQDKAKEKEKKKKTKDTALAELESLDEELDIEHDDDDDDY
jgi:hypothetical protein